MDEKRLPVLLNEWMRRYIDEPHAFQVQWQTVQTFLAEADDGVTPSYGDVCTAYLKRLDSELPR